MAEAERIADQLLKAFEGETWSGRSIQNLVAGISAQQAAGRPVASAHSPWEILRHVSAWVRVATIRLAGQAHDPTDEENFGPIADQTPAAWAREWADVQTNYRALAAAILRLPDEQLNQLVPGRDYPVYHLLHGVIQHSLYHAGQIALLCRTPTAS